VARCACRDADAISWRDPRVHLTPGSAVDMPY
jgi:hypothetical protein